MGRVNLEKSDQESLEAHVLLVLSDGVPMLLPALAKAVARDYQPLGVEVGAQDVREACVSLESQGLCQLLKGPTRTAVVLEAPERVQSGINASLSSGANL